MPGKKSAKSKTNDPNKINQSKVRNKFDGRLIAIINAKIPIIKKMICLEAKWNGELYISSET
jgi:hypothetical protein